MKVYGEESLIRKINSLPRKMQIEIYRRGVGSSAEIVKASAKRKAPGNDGDLRKSIKSKVSVKGNRVLGEIYTNLNYAPYVEFGTGPEGETNHSGISPNVNPTYRSKPWFIPGSVLSQSAISKYKFPEISIGKDKLYWTDGQKAQPFMYPALKENENKVDRVFKASVKRALMQVARR